MFMKTRWAWLPNDITVKGFPIALGNSKLTICAWSQSIIGLDFRMGEDGIPILAKLYGRESCSWSPSSVFTYMTVYG